MFSWLKASVQQATTPKVQQLWVFPIKSCRGTQVDESPYTAEGLEYDRQWMIVDAQSHKFLTARTLPKMVLIHPTIRRDTGQLEISVPSPLANDSAAAAQTFSVPLAHPTTYLENPDQHPSLDHDFVVWDSPAQDGYTVGPPELHAALSAYFGREVLLIRKGLTKRSVADVPGVVHSADLDPIVGFADFYALLLASATSLNELNRRVAEQVPDAAAAVAAAEKHKPPIEINRFRANVVVEGVKEPWEEDGWKQVRIGDELIEVGFRCARCMLPSVDPETAIRDKQIPDAVMTDRAVQPLSAPKVCFGMLASPAKREGGILRVGDPVTVLESYPRPTSGPYIRNEDRTN
ncbi:hypothetical protein JCM10908_000265 [Rhodotorula pacifica]|uniref:MOSC domain-containing protein n=1 Tax=Rhodotorula pacifica TaxID=1495444 RepID=UPI00317AFA26